MAHFSENNESRCPFWTECNSQCMRRLGGVYIPFPYYVELFCKSGQFTNCSHYLLGSLLTRERADSFRDVHSLWSFSCRRFFCGTPLYRYRRRVRDTITPHERPHQICRKTHWTRPGFSSSRHIHVWQLPFSPACPVRTFLHIEHRINRQQFGNRNVQQKKPLTHIELRAWIYWRTRHDSNVRPTDS